MHGKVVRCWLIKRKTSNVSSSLGRSMTNVVQPKLTDAFLFPESKRSSTAKLLPYIKTNRRFITNSWSTAIQHSVCSRRNRKTQFILYVYVYVYTWHELCFLVCVCICMSVCKFVYMLVSFPHVLQVTRTKWEVACVVECGIVDMGQHHWFKGPRTFQYFGRSETASRFDQKSKRMVKKENRMRMAKEYVMQKQL